MDNCARNCQVCSTAFDITLRRPHSLHCGHSFCTPCMNTLNENGHVKCPNCRRRHPVPSVGQFPINYALEAFLRSENVPNENVATGLPGSIRVLLHEQKTKVQAAILTCQEVVQELDHYHTNLTSLGDQHQYLEDKLQELKDQTQRARLIVRQEGCQVLNKKEQVQQGQQQMCALLQELNTLTTEDEAGTSVINVVRSIEEAEQTAQECRGMFPNVEAITTVREVMDTTWEALETAKTIHAAMSNAGVGGGGARGSGVPEAAASPITDRLQSLINQTLRVDDLRHRTQLAKNMLRNDLVFAVHRVEKQDRHARISLKDGRLYLHSLQDTPPPPYAAIVKMEELVPDMPPCLVFLDLAWPGTAPGRVVIRLNPDTPRGRQFLLLCTGQRGPSYAHSKFTRVWCKGFLGETLIGGAYESGKAPALRSSLNTGDYQKSFKAGSLVAMAHYSGARFAIMTRDESESVLYGPFANWLNGQMAFGEVVTGLAVVKAAANLEEKSLEQVTVVECGVVLWE